MQTNEQGDAFGAWLLKQVKREDWIGTLAVQAKADPRFRAATTRDELRQKLQEAARSCKRPVQGVTPYAPDDAENEWSGE